MSIQRTISKDVFLSFADADQAAARAIYDAILNRGGSAFFSAKDLAPGDDWPEKIREQLQGAESLWLLATPTSLKSDWVLTEWGAAWALGMKIVPIFLRCSAKDLPDRLARMQGVDYHNFQSLIENTFSRRNADQSPTDDERKLIDDLLRQDRIVHAISVGKPYLHSKRFDKCLPIFEYIRDHANKAHFDYYIVLGNIGYSLLGLGRNKEAINYFEQVRTYNNGTTFHGWHALEAAVAYLREGRTAEAKEMIAFAKNERTQQFLDTVEQKKAAYPELVSYL